MEAGPPLETCGLATLPKGIPWAEGAFGPLLCTSQASELFS